MNQEPQITTSQNLNNANNSNNQPQFNDSQSYSRGGKNKKLVISLLSIVLLAAAVFGGYVYGKGKTPSTATKNNQPAVSNTQQEAAQSSATLHFVRAEGYPFEDKGRVFTIDLGIPNEMQGVRISSNNNNHGSEQYFTDKYNDEIGRWIIGDPTVPTESFSGVSALAISKSWLGANLPQDLASNSEFDTGYNLATPADKQKFLQKVKADASSCSNDAKKGFVTNDKSFEICYSFDPGKEGYSPTVLLSGYGEKDSIPIYITGLIELKDDTPMPDRDAEAKAIQDAHNGKYTPKASAALSSLINALKQTKLTVTNAN